MTTPLCTPKTNVCGRWVECTCGRHEIPSPPSPKQRRNADLKCPDCGIVTDGAVRAHISGMLGFLVAPWHWRDWATYTLCFWATARLYINAPVALEGMAEEWMR